MARGKILAICRSGGEFVVKRDGCMSYTGGEAHAIDIDRDMTLCDLMSEISNMFNWECNSSTFSVKYFLPGNKETLITVSNDKDLQRMVDFNTDLITTDVYVLKKFEDRAIVCAVADPGPPVAATTPMESSSHTVATTPKESKRQKKSDAWENIITGEGQVFDNVKDFREALHKFAIAKGFKYKFIKNDGIRVTAECSAEHCTWRIHASKLPDEQKFVLKKINNTHTCGGETGKSGHCLASKRWLASVIKDKLQDSPDYKAKEIINDFYKEYGVNLSYAQAWHGKSVAWKELSNYHEEASSQLFWFCERIKETNPGSVATLVTTDDSKFHRLFVCFHASLHGFEHGCCPLLFLDGISLKVSRQWKLLVATAVDGENDIFPVAFAVVEAETDGNWHWFLEQLKSVLSMLCRTITYMSNRQNGLDEAVSQVFEDSNHGYCLSNLIEDFKAELEESWAEEVKNEMVDHLISAAYAYKVDEFNACVESMKNVSKDVAKWVLASKPECWSNAFFKGLRYDNLSSNAAKLFNTWITKVTSKEPSVVQIVDMIRCQIMELIYTRRGSTNTWTEILTPSMDQKLRQESTKASSLEVICSTGTVFEVSGNANHTVNTESWECSCRRWQVTGLPCVHAIAVFEQINGCVYDYCSKYFKTECYRLTYSLSINPIPDVGRNADPYPDTAPYSPRLRRLPGRPKEKPIELHRLSRSVQCSRCKVFGHNRKTCNANI